MSENINTTSTNAACEARSKVHADRLVALLETKINRLQAEAAECIGRLNAIKAAYDSLPAAAASGSTGPRFTPAIGAKIAFRAGRGATATERVGTVVGIKTGEEGKAEQYKVSSGEGFDAAFYNVFPGQIIGIEGDSPVSEPAPTVADEPLNTDEFFPG